MREQRTVEEDMEEIFGKVSLIGLPHKSVRSLAPTDGVRSNGLWLAGIATAMAFLIAATERTSHRDLLPQLLSTAHDEASTKNFDFLAAAAAKRDHVSLQLSLKSDAKTRRPIVFALKSKPTHGEPLRLTESALDRAIKEDAEVTRRLNTKALHSITQSDPI